MPIRCMLVTDGLLLSIFCHHGETSQECPLQGASLGDILWEISSGLLSSPRDGLELIGLGVSGDMVVA